MTPDAPRAEQRLSAIIGFRLVTADLPRLRGFYQEVLGCLPEGPEQEIGSDELRLLGLTGCGRRQMVRINNSLMAIEQFDPPGRPYPATGNAASLWFQHLALVVFDMNHAYQRVRTAAAISQGGPQRLPVSSGGVDAYKFRDPDGHPLELLQFSDGSRPGAWHGETAIAGQIAFGIDHSAISVADADASTAFYGALGLRPGARTLNRGLQQRCLDDLPDVQVTVAPMHGAQATPHLELLDYRVPRGAAGPTMQANDIAATRIVWRGTRAALVRGPDGHLMQITTAAHGSSQ